jgi:cell division protein FtsI (penicillin-binding protein 3)
MRDNRNRIVGNVESIRAARPGQDLTLSIDRRIQYLTHQALAAAVRKHRAKAASMVVMDVTTGEVLAMANQPTYNPNNRKDLKSDRFRNRAVADVFEPGSTMKPFTVAAGLETGRFSPGTMIDTRPGQLTIGKYIVKDLHNCGVVNLSTLIAKSSNVGATKIALAIGPDRLWQVLHGGGFGQSTQTGFPGELAGRLPSPRHLPPIAQATLSFGYGLSVTTLQLAQAYTMFATDGRVVPASFQPVSERPEGKRVISAHTARAVRAMLEGVVTRGTGQAAHIPGYRVAGKTGTVHKTFGHGYAAHRYLSLFAGLVPVTNPRLVAVVMIDEPAGGVHFGGDVAAPVFAEVLTGAVRLMDIAPDDRDALPAAGPQPILTQADKGNPASAKDRVAQQ